MAGSKDAGRCARRTNAASHAPHRAGNWTPPPRGGHAVDTLRPCAPSASDGEGDGAADLFGPDFDQAAKADEGPKGSSMPDGSRKERLMKEAESVRHLLTHLPKNPYCPVCQTGKLVKVHHRRRVPEADEAVELPNDATLCERCGCGDREEALLLCDGMFETRVVFCLAKICGQEIPQELKKSQLAYVLT